MRDLNASRIDRQGRVLHYGSLERSDNSQCHYEGCKGYKWTGDYCRDHMRR